MDCQKQWIVPILSSVDFLAQLLAFHMIDISLLVPGAQGLRVESPVPGTVSNTKETRSIC